MTTDSLQPIYDAATLAQLQELIDDGDTSFLDDLFATYIETAEANLRLLREDTDRDTLRRAAHTLKGSSLNVGAAGVAGLCKMLEVDLAKAAVADLPERVATIEDQLNRVRCSYGAKIQELVAGATS